MIYTDEERFTSTAYDDFQYCSFESYIAKQK